MRILYLFICLVFLKATAVEISASITERRQFRTELKNAADPVRYAQKNIVNRDGVIRRGALVFLYGKLHEKALPELTGMVEDPEFFVRMAVLDCLSGLAGQEPQAMAAIGKLSRDPMPAIRNRALQLSWPFKRDVLLIRDNPEWDHNVEVVKTLILPNKQWRFITDHQADGHLKGYFRKDFNDSKWKYLDIGYWERQGYPNYDGVGWYRLEFGMPDKVQSNAVELNFGGVDDSAHVWLNGIYLGGFDGGVGEPFSLDATAEVIWGGVNQLTVRVLDTGEGGGLCKPVKVEILK